MKAFRVSRSWWNLLRASMPVSDERMDRIDSLEREM
jgi:hypothetical protein